MPHSASSSPTADPLRHQWEHAVEQGEAVAVAGQAVFVGVRDAAVRLVGNEESGRVTWPRRSTPRSCSRVYFNRPARDRPVKCSVNQMTFSDEDLRKFASWDSVALGFDRNVSRHQDRAICEHIQPLILELTRSGKLKAHILEDGGVTNYFAMLVCAEDIHKEALLSEEPREVPGLMVLLSLLAPVGVFGRSTISLGRTYRAWSLLEPHEVADPTKAEGLFEEEVLGATKLSAYVYLSRAEIEKPLPAGVVPYEYCLSNEPWDRVFHVLFSNTD